MKNYDQAEIGPINESSLILLNLICGGIILNEQKLYLWWELVILLMCCIVCILGIKIFISKPKLLLLEKLRRKQTSTSSTETLMEQNDISQISCSANEQDDSVVIIKYEK